MIYPRRNYFVIKLNWDLIKKWRVRTYQVAAIVIILFIVGSWYFAAVSVVEYKVGTGNIVAEVMGTGTLEARVKSTISSKIPGRLQEIPVDQADKVSSGQLLFTLEDSELKQQVEIAKATLDFWQASLDRLEADHNQAKAVLEAAAKEFNRSQKLVTAHAISTQQNEGSVERFRIAEAGLSRAVAAELEGQRQITTAEKTLDFNVARLADTRVVAPFDGVIVKRYRDPGDISVPGSPILMLVSTNELWISAWVDETEISRLREDQDARVVFRSESTKNYPAKVSRLGKETDRETREFVVDVSVLKMPQNWAVGQRAEVFIEVDRKTDVIIVPSKFISWKDKIPGVYTRAGSHAVWREVSIGVRGSDNTEITKGLTVGEVVVMPAADVNKIPLDNKRVTTR